MRIRQNYYGTMEAAGRSLLSGKIPMMEGEGNDQFERICEETRSCSLAKDAEGQKALPDLRQGL